MTLFWLMNLGFAGGAPASVPSTLGDLTTLFAGYLVTLNAAQIAEDDNNTLVANDLTTVRAAVPTELDDLNTLYARHLSD